MEKLQAWLVEAKDIALGWLASPAALSQIALLIAAYFAARYLAQRFSPVVERTLTPKPEATLARIPKGVDYYLTLDIDGFDPSIAPGTGTPSHGGFLYYEVLELIDGLTKQGRIIGIDLVEVAPDYDHSGTTTILAAQILLNTIGRIAHNAKA